MLGEHVSCSPSQDLVVVSLYYQPCRQDSRTEAVLEMVLSSTDMHTKHAWIGCLYLLSVGVGHAVAQDSSSEGLSLQGKSGYCS